MLDVVADPFGLTPNDRAIVDCRLDCACAVECSKRIGKEQDKKKMLVNIINMKCEHMFQTEKTFCFNKQ